MSHSYNPNQYLITCSNEGTTYETWSDTLDTIVCPTHSNHQITVLKKITEDFVSERINENRKTTMADPHIGEDTLNTNLVNLKFEYYHQEGIVTYKKTGAAYNKFDQNKSRLELNTASNNDHIIGQSIVYFPVMTDTVRRSLLTFNVSELGDTEFSVGLYDNHYDKTVDSRGDGVFITFSNYDYSFVNRTSFYNDTQQDLIYPRDEWNIDPLNNTLGNNGFILDLTKTTTMVIDQFCNENGSTTFGFMTYRGIIWAHRIIHNDHQCNIVRRWQLPFRVEIKNLDINNNPKNINLYSLSIQTSHNIFVRAFISSHECSSKAITTTEGIVFSTKLQNQYCRLLTRFTSLEVFSNVDCIVKIYIGTYALDGSWNNSDVVQVNETITTSAVPGSMMKCTYVSANQFRTLKFLLDEGRITDTGDYLSDLYGNPVEYSVKARALTTNGTINTSFEFLHF